MLEKKIEKAINYVNKIMATEEIRYSDQGKDAVRNVLRGCTHFENTFDKIIEAGKNEVDESKPKGGKKEKLTLPQNRLTRLMHHFG